MCYITKEHLLVSNAVVETALRLDEKEHKRDEKLHKARRARPNTPAR